MKKKCRKNKMICCFVLLGVVLAVTYMFPYYDIYKKEAAEKRRIHQLTQLQFYEKIQKYPPDNPFKYYKYNHKKENIADSDNKNTSHKDIHSQENKPSENPEAGWPGDCILIIPDINLEKIVYTGKNREQHLENYELITASENMEYGNGGNYIICGHASRLYGHSLNRLKEVKKGTKIQIRTKEKNEEYIVNKVTYENMNNTSKYCNQTQNNTLTIISCAKYISEESYIVIHAERK